MSPVMMLFPVLSTQIYLMRKRSENGPKLPNSFFSEEQDPEISQTSSPHLTTEGHKLSSLETPITKCHVKHGPVKSSKKLKYKPKEGDE